MSTPRGIRYIPAIDGLRAVAVIAVMLYHLGFTWIPGGFLGVDLFFVISGYVITRLLLDSIQRSGGLDLRAFYKARIRRLFPPLVFMIFVTIIYISIWAPETMRRFISDSPFALLGGMNWWLVFRQTDYFDTISRPPLLQHTWSLGVEAQFYLIWPLILLLVLRQFGKANFPARAGAIQHNNGLAQIRFHEARNGARGDIGSTASGKGDVHGNLPIRPPAALRARNGGCGKGAGDQRATR